MAHNLRWTSESNPSFSTRNYYVQLPQPYDAGYGQQATQILRWYNRYERSWVTSFADADGHQVGSSEYDGTLEDAYASAQELYRLATATVIDTDKIHGNESGSYSTREELGWPEDPNQWPTEVVIFGSVKLRSWTETNAQGVVLYVNYTGSQGFPTLSVWNAGADPIEPNTKLLPEEAYVESIERGGDDPFQLRIRLLKWLEERPNATEREVRVYCTMIMACTAVIAKRIREATHGPDWTTIEGVTPPFVACGSGWTGDRCELPLHHEGPHDNREVDGHGPDGDQRDEDSRHRDPEAKSGRCDGCGNWRLVSAVWNEAGTSFQWMCETCERSERRVQHQRALDAAIDRNREAQWASRRIVAN